MRLLLDSAFPDSTVAEASGPTLLTRWAGDDVGDAELVALADNEGFGAIVFVGPQAAARSEILELARKCGVCVVVTTSEDPVAAKRDLLTHLASVTKQITPGALVWVTSHGARPAS